MISSLILMVWATLAALPDLGPVYVVCLIVGGGLLLISTVLGGHGGVGDVHAPDGLDVGHGLDVGQGLDAGHGLDAGDGLDAQAGADIGHGAPDAHAEAGGHHDAVHGHPALSSWFSIRFVVYFVAVLGMVGTTLTYLTDLARPAVLFAAGACGLLVGQAVHQVVRYLTRSGCGSELAASDYLGRPARVTVTIDRPPACGEAAVVVRGGERFIVARAHRPDDRFSVGDEVAVVRLCNGVAEVVSRKEYEFLHETGKGGKQ